MTEITDPFRAFQQGRLVTERHMDRMLRTGNMFSEETLTDLLLVEAHEFGVRFRKFTRREESRNGADWLWWWVDATGISFGMLVQAKILKKRSETWHIDFGYRRDRTGPRQIDTLIAASDDFKVPAAHVLYCGTPDYRAGLDCGLSHPEGAHCRDRERAGVSIVPSILPQYLAPTATATLAGTARDTLAAEAFHYAQPLEDIADPEGPQTRMRSLAKADRDVVEFLWRPQIGARRVAKAMLEHVHAARMRQFSAAAVEMMPPVDDAVFPRLPADRGHFPRPYMDHILRGLRHRPPDYVQDVLDGRTPPPSVTSRIAGIAVVRDPAAFNPAQAADPGNTSEVRTRHLSVARPDSHDRTTGTVDRLAKAFGGSVSVY